MTTDKTVVADQLEILDIIRENDITYTFKCSRPEGIVWDVGSNGHFSFRQPTGEKETDRPWQRHMTVTSHPDEDYISFTTRIRNEASLYKNKLKNLKTGDRILLYGLNNRMPVRREGRPLVFVTMGVAITSCRPYFLEYIRDGRGIPSVTSLNMEGQGAGLLKGELDLWNPGAFSDFRFIVREEFYKALEKVVSSGNDSFFYVMGSDGFLRDICRFLLERGVEDNSIVIDKKKSAVSFLQDCQR